MMYAVSGETLKGIANAIRGKTGSDDFMQVASMAAAIEGISTGGGEITEGIKYDVGTFILDAEAKYINVNHNLGEKPTGIIVWCDDFATLKPAKYGTSNDVVGFLWFKNLTRLKQRLTSSVSANDGSGLTINMLYEDTTNRVNLSIPTSISYCFDIGSLKEHSFKSNIVGANSYYRANIEYHYFVFKGLWDDTLTE